MANNLIIKSETALILAEQFRSEELLKPLQKEILLFETYIAGTTYLEDDSIIEELTPGERLSLKREKENHFDENAIRVEDKDGRKLGYIPEKDNLVYARLMDAGKMLFAKIIQIKEKIGYTQVEIELYMSDF